MSYKKLCLLKNFGEKVTGDEPYLTPVFGLPFSAKTHTWHILVTPAEGEEPVYPAALDIELQGTIDGVNWFTLDSSTNTEGEAKFIDGKLVDFIRVKINEFDYEGETNPVVNIWYIGR